MKIQIVLVAFLLVGFTQVSCDENIILGGVNGVLELLGYNSEKDLESALGVVSKIVGDFLDDFLKSAGNGKSRADVLIKDGEDMVQDLDKGVEKQWKITASKAKGKPKTTKQ